MKRTIISRDTLENILWFSAKNNVRPSLSGIYIDIDDDGHVTLACTDSFRLHEVKWWSINGIFPDYTRFFDTTTDPIVINEDAILCLIANCKQALVMDKWSYIKLWDGFAYTWEQEVRLPSSGQFKLPHQVKLNAKFLLDLLKIIPKKAKVYVRSRDPLSAVTFEWEDNGKNTHILMPIK